MSHAHPHAVNELDPHGEHPHAHGHVIITSFKLTTILAVLLFFTVATVGASLLETWIASASGVHIPSWVNAIVAMSIALVKATLVAMFFMQLRYDNTINSLVLLFSIFAVTLFLFFSMIDLGGRSSVLPYKAGEIIQGGTHVGLTEIKDPEGAPSRANKPIVQWARENHEWKLQTIAGNLLKGSARGAISLPPSADKRTRQIAEHLRAVMTEMEAKGELTDVQVQSAAIVAEAARRQFEDERHEAHAHSRGGHSSHGPAISDPDQSRPLTADAIRAWVEHHAHEHAGHDAGHDAPASHDAGGGH